jgi:YD repeat-containing protein
MEASVSPFGYRTTFLYNLRGEQTARLNARGYRTGYEYDALGQPTAETDPLGRRTTTLYDAAGRQRGKRDAVGNANTYYNLDNGWLQQTRYPGNVNVNYNLNRVGEVNRVIEPLGRWTLAYDAVRRLTAVTRGISALCPSPLALQAGGVRSWSRAWRIWASVAGETRPAVGSSRDGSTAVSWKTSATRERSSPLQVSGSTATVPGKRSACTSSVSGTTSTVGRTALAAASWRTTAGRRLG